MLGSVPTAPKKLEDYRHIVGNERIDEIRAIAAPLQGARVLQVNATSFGGGVAEILTTGEYHDVIVAESGTFLFASRKAILDTSVLPRYIVYPV